ncbi:MAG TPA: hypothetical protein VMJ66_06905 [Geobacteraceae bacterium]|nr:hypothetical protein [Geobacteraceae bacterium]
MKWASVNRRIRLYIIAAAILATGLLSAAVIYLRAESASDNALIDEIEYSKRYQHDLELYGGKANVLATEITNWFKGLWRGKRLAYTIAFITLLISCGFFYAGRHTPDDKDSAGGSGTGGQI